MRETENSALAGRRGEKACPRCGAVFVCGMDAGKPRCWCADLPPLPVDATVAGCLCPACLAQRARELAET